MQDPTVGMEIEFCGVASKGIDFLKPMVNYKIGDDNSTREQTYSIDGLPIVLQKSRGGGRVMPSGVVNEDKTGLELITHPYPATEMLVLTGELSKLLGHIPQTARTSVHFHVDVANRPWTYVKRVVLWAYYVEAILYRLSCGGGIHRGERRSNEDGGHNDYRYARPLSNSIGVHWGGLIAPVSVGPLISMRGIIESKSATEFVGYWGRLDTMWSNDRLAHYCPHRLHGVNIVSILRQGTLEWRLCDALYNRLDNMLRFILAIHTQAETQEPDLAADPLLLGEEADLGAQEVSQYLDCDVTDLWGTRWPSKPVSNARLSHYKKMVLPTIQELNLMPITNNAGQTDRGHDSFTLFARR